MKPFVRAVGGLRHSVIYTDADGRHYRFYDGTWAWRNHNPGNLRPGVYAHIIFAWRNTHRKPLSLCSPRLRLSNATQLKLPVTIIPIKTIVSHMR